MADLAPHERANECTEDEKQRIIEAVKEIGGKLHPPKESVKYLFKMFDKYIQPYPEKNMSCNGCRVMVRGFWKRIVEKIWS